MLRAVVFDLDGVLIDSEPLMRMAFKESYHLILGAGEPPIEAFLEHMGESFPTIMEKLNLPLSLWQPYRQICQQRLDMIKLFPQAPALLAFCRAHKLQIALLTGKDYRRTLQILQHFQLAAFFDVVVASDQLTEPKPHPQGLRHILATLDCPAQRAVMIGDAVSDILCAHNAGVTAVAVTWGIKPELVQSRCQAEYVVHDWAELEARIFALHSRQVAAPITWPMRVFAQHSQFPE